MYIELRNTNVEDMKSVKVLKTIFHVGHKSKLISSMVYTILLRSRVLAN